MDVRGCPEPGCSAPAEVVEWAFYESTSGPLRQARTRCLSGHVRDDHAETARLGRDLPCGTCRHVHRWLPCDCGCPAHPLSDDVEP